MALAQTRPQYGTSSVGVDEKGVLILKANLKVLDHFIISPEGVVPHGLIQIFGHERE